MVEDGKMLMKLVKVLMMVSLFLTATHDEQMMGNA